MHSQIVNYNAREPGRRRRTPWWRRHLVNVGFFLHQVPRPLLPCRLFGHRPVVDGTTVTPANRPGYLPSRWVVCDRCGVRPDPQGHLDPRRWDIDARYTGEWGPAGERPPRLRVVRQDRPYDQAEDEHNWHPPGPFRRRATGGLGGQLVVIGNPFGVGFELKVGNGGSEHTLAAHLYLGWLGALYLNTERIGTWLQRRLNPVGYQSRIIEVRFSRGELRWRLWAKRDESSRDDPWWMDGKLSFRLRDKLLGRRLYDYTDVPGGQVARFVRMPEGDYLVNLKLQAVTLGRKRWFKKRMPYSVDWSALGKGIPTEGPLRGRIFGSSVQVSDRAVTAGTWPAEAAAAIALRVAEHRTREGWEPTGKVPVQVAA